MRKISITLLISLLLGVFAQAQQSTQTQESKPPATKPSGSRPPATTQTEAKPSAPTPQPPQVSSNFIPPADAGVRIEADLRTMIVMAALNIAGFDYEPSGQPLTPLRVQVRKDLASTDPALKAKIAQFYKANKKAGTDEGIEASRYAILSLLMTQPPAMRIYEDSEDDVVVRAARTVPADLKPLVDFSNIASEFYIKSKIREFLPTYLAVGQVYTNAYRQTTGELIYEVAQYFHLMPETTINMKPLVIGTDAGIKGKKDKSRQIARTRSRNVFIIPDPLSSYGTAFVRGDILNQKDDLVYRRVGDDYIVILGPSRTPNIDAIRNVLIRYTIDPVIERHLRKSLEFKDQIATLVASVPGAQKEYASSVYLVLRESLAQAAEARLRRINATQGRGSYTEDDAIYDLSQAYQKGAVLSFHFYDALKGLEKVGIGIEDFFDEMVATTKFDREPKRPAEFGPVVARVIADRKAKAEKAAREPDAPRAVNSASVNKMLLSDDLLRQRRFKEAGVLLEEVVVMEPNNARALFGLAQVTNQSPSAAELDASADENDKIQSQHERLEKSIKLYRRAIEAASKENESWIIQWSHVYIGRILDFQEFRVDALAEYDKAIAMGEIANGAYKEALDGKKRPHGQN